MSPRPGKEDLVEGGRREGRSRDYAMERGPGGEQPPQGTAGSKEHPGGESQGWAVWLPGVVLTGRGSPPSGTPSARRQATRHTGGHQRHHLSFPRTPLPAPRWAVGMRTQTPSALALTGPCCPHVGHVAVLTPPVQLPPQGTTLWGHPYPSRRGRHGVGAHHMPGSIWVAWPSRVKPLALTPLGSTLRIHPRILPAGGGTRGWYVPS